MRGVRRLLVSFYCLAICVAGQPATAESWPHQDVRIIVPFPAGSGIDVAARVIADGLGKQWKKAVVVENKPGGETAIGAGAFVAARDGHTLLYTTFGTLSVAPLTVEKLPFDPKTDLVPLVPTASVVVAISVTNSLPVRTLADLETVIRSKPGQLAWASSPTLPRYVFATFLKQRGLEMNYVAYRDASQPQIDLGEGRIHAFIAAISTSSASVTAGKARFIATTEPRRTAILPDVPSADEAGYGEFTFVGGTGLFGWRDMPEPIRDRVITSVNAVLSDPAVAEKLKAAGQQVIGGSPEVLEDLIERQRTRVLEISKLIDLRAAK